MKTKCLPLFVIAVKHMKKKFGMNFSFIRAKNSCEVVAQIRVAVWIFEVNNPSNWLRWATSRLLNDDVTSNEFFLFYFFWIDFPTD